MLTFSKCQNVINTDKLFQDNVTDPENGQEKNENEELKPLHDENQQVHHDDNDNDNNNNNDNDPEDNKETRL